MAKKMYCKQKESNKISQEEEQTIKKQVKASYNS